MVKAACDVLPVSEYEDRIDEEVKIEMYCMLVWVGYQMGRKAGWSAHAYREMFGAWPAWQWKNLNPIPATAAVEKWVASRDARARREYKREKSGGTLFDSNEKIGGSDGSPRADGEVEGRSDEQDLASGCGAEPDG